MEQRLHNDCDGGFCVACCEIQSPSVDQVECDDLKCPACEGAPVMTVSIFCSDEVEDGTVIVCPQCGFQVAGRDEAQVEAAIELLWDYGLPWVDEEKA